MGATKRKGRGTTAAKVPKAVAAAPDPATKGGAPVPAPYDWRTHPDWVPPLYRTLKRRNKDGREVRVFLSDKELLAQEVAEMKARLEAQLAATAPDERGTGAVTPEETARWTPKVSGVPFTPEDLMRFDLDERTKVLRKNLEGAQAEKSAARIEEAERALFAHVRAFLKIDPNEYTGDKRANAVRLFGRPFGS